MHGVLSVSLSASFFNHTLRPLTTQGLKKQLYAAAVTRAQFFYVYIFGLFTATENPSGDHRHNRKRIQVGLEQTFLVFYLGGRDSIVGNLKDGY